MLLAGARRALDAAGAVYDVVTVPGALEIPQAVSFALESSRGTAYQGVVALGCVIRGETSHYDIVAGESARALMDIGIATGVPVGNGILTVDTPRRRAAAPTPTVATRAASPPPPRSRSSVSSEAGSRRRSRNDPRAAKSGRPAQGQSPRRGAACRGAGALSDGHGGRRPQRDPGAVRKPLARPRGRRRAVSACGSRVLPRYRLRRGGDPARPRSEGSTRRWRRPGRSSASRRSCARSCAPAPGSSRRAPTSRRG